MKKLAALTLSVFLTAGTALADTPKDADAPQPSKSATPAKPKAAKKADSKDAAIAAELEELRQTLQSQQEQLQMLKEELAKRDRQIDEARDAAAAASSRAAEATVKATEAASTSAEVKSSEVALSSTVGDLKASNAALTSSVATVVAKPDSNGQGGASDEGPATIRYKGVSLTPGGFLAAETIYRTRATGGDIATPFTGIPFQAADIAHVSENNFTGRQSRISLLAESKFGWGTTSGYYEGDFLGAGTTSNNRQTNSYVFRQRQAFAQAAFNSGTVITGGQMWSLVTETKKGLANRQEDLTMQIDPNYVVGFTWARQYGFRVVQNFGNKFALGFSLEGPQATIGGRGFSSVTTINSAAAPATIVTSGATTAATGNFFLNGPGAGAGLYNAFDATGYTTNKAPDLIFKAAADPGFGHYELFGIVSFFRDRVYPCGVVGTNADDTETPAVPTTLACGSAKPTTVSSFGATNVSTTGGGVGASALWSLHKKADFGIKGVAGDGIGRYGAAQLADATARPDGTLSLIRTVHGLARLELHPVPKLDVYAYYGLEYAWRSGYSGYDTITVTKTAAIPATATSGAIPATTTTKISTTGIGGYGNVAATNSGCATEGTPINDFNPSGGGSCAGDIRIIQEGTLGFWYRFYQGSKGRFQFGAAYSYLAKNAYSGTGGVEAGGTAISPKGIDNMIWTSLRYYIP
jgi:hypothetical protein